MRSIATFGIVAGLVGSVSAQTRGTQSGLCDRDCLHGFVEQYLDALFKVENGLLHEIEAVLERAPYGMGSGWST